MSIIDERLGLEGEWTNLQTLMDFISENLMTVNTDFVLNNFDFKYVDIRVDMRSGNAILYRGTKKTDLIKELEKHKQVVEAANILINGWACPEDQGSQFDYDWDNLDKTLEQLETKK